MPSPAAGYRPPSYGRDLTVVDPVDAMREVIPLMRRDGAQLIVVLSHMGTVGQLDLSSCATAGSSTVPSGGTA